jgi:hypothetical protein
MSIGIRMSSMRRPFKCRAMPITNYQIMSSWIAWNNQSKSSTRWNSQMKPIKTSSLKHLLQKSMNSLSNIKPLQLSLNKLMLTALLSTKAYLRVN